ncbi:MAG: hypothetical protein ACLVJ3_07065 [Coprococcus phoceensis]
MKLRAQINRDYENSSIPSSKVLRRKKITNSREKRAGNREDSPVIRGTAERNRNLRDRQSFFHRQKKSLKTVLLKRLQGQS